MKNSIPIKIIALVCIMAFQVALFAGKKDGDRTVKIESTIKKTESVTVTITLSKPFSGNLYDIKFNADGWSTKSIAINDNVVSVALTSDFTTSNNGKYNCDFGGVIEGIDVDNITGVKIGGSGNATHAVFTPFKSNTTTNGQGDNNSSNSGARNVGDSQTSEFDDTNYFAPGFQLNTNHLDVSDVKLFPNPFVNEFDVILVEEVVVKTVIIYNMTGKRILTKQPAYSTNQIQVKMNGFKPGIYIVQINTNKGTVSVRIIKGR